MTFRLNPFNKSSTKKSAISSVSEREFERETKKIENLEEATKKIQESAKKCIKSQKAQAKFETEIVQNLQNNALYKEDDKIKDILDFWLSAVKPLEIQMEDLNALSAKTIVEPMKKFETIFPSLQKSIKKREQLLQEYSKCQASVEKYSNKERTGDNIVNLKNSQISCEAAKTKFEQHNSMLLDEIPKLYDSRIMYFQPSLQAFTKVQEKYYSESQEIYGNLYKQLNDQGSVQNITDKSDLKKNIQQTLAEIRVLSITVDDQIK